MSGQLRTLLAVHAHPDDETITMGGTLARYSAEGVRTVVITCTRGDLGEVRDSALIGQDVASVRERELQAAGRVLGVSRIVHLGYSDSGWPAGAPENYRPGAFFVADLCQVVQKLVEIIEQERPQVLVTYDESGGYGHPDHVKAHQVTAAALEATGTARPAKFYVIRFPLTWSREFVRALRAAGIDAPGSAPSGADAGPETREIGTPDELVTTAIDTRRYVPAKLAALACHPSQIPPDHFLRRMSRELAERLWAHEYFSRRFAQTPLENNNVEADLFAGLD